MEALQRRFPAELALMGETTARLQVREGAERARRLLPGDARRATLFVLGWTLAWPDEARRAPALWAERCRRARLPARGRRSLVLRAPHMEAMEAMMRERRRQRVLAHLQRVFPERGGTSALVERCFEKAARHGIEDERSLCMLADLMLTLGEDFEARAPHAWCAKILSAALPPRAKLDLIFLRLQAESADARR